MGFADAIKSGFSNYVNFKGRSPRAEFWWWYLFQIIVYVVAMILDRSVLGYDGPGMIYGLAGLALFLPSIGMAIRRLHDIDRTGWWLLIALTGIGAIVLLVWWLQQSQPGANRFGPNPYGM